MNEAIQIFKTTMQVAAPAISNSQFNGARKKILAAMAMRPKNNAPLNKGQL
jgi:hypothetical protein